ncbi:MAG: hypothetical protein G01um101444_71 [Parcubacteria group bacterium Gr01-1014_44]|nr:MAG: hypothetical protein G01um101444_71 [Parcubacteria group bacterium Gr01-1014_44]
MTNKDDKSFDGLDISKIGQGSLIGTAVTPEKNLEGLDLDFDDSEGLLPENFTEIFQTALKNIISATGQIKLSQNPEDLKEGRDIFLDLPVSTQKARQGGYVYLEYQRYIFCSQCRDKNTLRTPNCLKCNGAGRVPASRRVEIKIPKDTVAGAVLQINNEGHAPGGDLFVKVVFHDEV